MNECNYKVFLPATITKARSSFAVSLGDKSDDIAQLYDSHQVTTCAFLSAYNPGGTVSDPISNLQHQSGLFSFLADCGFTWFDGASITEPDQYDQTPCALVMGIDLNSAHFAARQFGQPSFIFAGADAVPKMVRTSGNVTAAPRAQDLDVLDNGSDGNGFRPRRDLVALARMYGIEASSIDGLIRFISAVAGARDATPDLVPALFGSAWQRLGEQLEHLYSEQPDDLVLEIGHRAAGETTDLGAFRSAATFSLADVRHRFERRLTPRAVSTS